MAPEKTEPKAPRFPKIGRRALISGGAATIFAAGLAFGARMTFGPIEPIISVPDDLMWGVNGHPITAYPGITIEEQLDLVRALGFTHYRINCKGDGSPAELDHFIKLAAHRGITLVPILFPYVSLENDSIEILKARGFELGKRMAHKFKDRLAIWELGNELENFAILQPCENRDDGTQYPCEWGPAGGVEASEYHGPRWRKVSAVLMGMSEGVAAGNPKAKRAIGTAGFGHLGAFDRLADDGVPWDISVWHDYETITEPYLEKLASFGKPIWITEFNAGGGGGVSPEDNARMLAQRIGYYRDMREKYNVAAAFIYELLDETYWGDTYEARMGLVGIEKIAARHWRPGALKPAALAVQQLISKPKP